MNAVIYYSNTGECKRVAEYLGQHVNYGVVDIANAAHGYENAALVFPVHCQNVPKVVKDYLRLLSADNLTLIACYGKMSHGNVLYEIQRKYSHNIIAAAYVPAKHAYISEGRFDDFCALLPVIDKMRAPEPILIPKSAKNPLANVFKNLRSRIGVKIIRNDKCNGCGFCQKTCLRNAIFNGKTNRKCIRCLKCVESCPQRALTFKTRGAMKTYLKKKRCTELAVYV